MSPNMLDRLKSLPLTIVLTILIWMYAEAKFTATQDNVHLTLKPVSAKGDLLLRAFDPADGRYQSTLNLIVTLEGPKNQVDRIYQESVGSVPQDDEFAALAYVPPEGAMKVGAESRVDAVTALNGLRYFRQRGVTITSASPSHISLEADHLVQFTKPVDFHPAFAVERFTATPDQVLVKIPEQLLDNIGGADQISVTAVPLRDLTALPAGTQQNVPVRYVVNYPGVGGRMNGQADGLGGGGAWDDGVTVTPAQGQVLMVLPKHQQESVVVPEVPVWVSGPPAVLARYDVTILPKMLRVTVTGAAPAVEALRRQLVDVGSSATAIGGEEEGVRAYLDLGPDDRASDAATRRGVRFTAPDGLSVQTAANVDFRLTEKPRTVPPAH